MESSLFSRLHGRAVDDIKKMILEMPSKQHPLDFFEDVSILYYSHREKFLGAPIFVEDTMGVFAELFHERAYKHLTQLHEVTVILVVDFYDSLPKNSRPRRLIPMPLLIIPLPAV